MNEDTLAQELSQLLVDKTREMLRLSELLSSSGENGVMLWLNQQRGRVYAVDISAHLGLTQGRVANIVKKLEQRGYIARAHNSEDQRLRVITLTEAGQTQAEALWREMNQKHLALIRTLGEEDGENMVALFKRIADKLENT